jgi:hypothetical protein
LAIAFAGAGVLVFVGCGGSGTKPATSTTATTATTATTKSSLEGLTADQVLAKTKAAAQSARSVRVKGEVTDSGQSISIDLKLAGVASGSGTVIQSGGRIDLVRVGNDIYFKADEKTLSKTLAQGDAQVVKLIAGRYVKATVTTSGFDSFAGLLDLVEFVKGVLSPDGKVKRVDGKPVSGVATVGLKDTAATGGGILYVADAGEPFPLRIEPGSGTGGVTMSDWNTDITITAPPADQVIDVSKLK